MRAYFGMRAFCVHSCVCLLQRILCVLVYVMNNVYVHSNTSRTSLHHYKPIHLHNCPCRPLTLSLASMMAFSSTRLWTNCLLPSRAAKKRAVSPLYTTSIQMRRKRGARITITNADLHDPKNSASNNKIRVRVCIRALVWDHAFTLSFKMHVLVQECARVYFRICA